MCYAITALGTKVFAKCATRLKCGGKKGWGEGGSNGVIFGFINDKKMRTGQVKANQSALDCE